jgi:hypothetical protein
MLLSTLFSNTLSLCASLNVREQVSHPYRTTGKITVVCILIVIFLDSRREDKGPPFLWEANKIQFTVLKYCFLAELKRLPRFLDNRLTDGCEVVSLTRRPPFTPSAIVRLERLGQLKNPVTSSVIELATFRLVEYCLNELGYRVPLIIRGNRKKIKITWYLRFQQRWQFELWSSALWLV